MTTVIRTWTSTKTNNKNCPDTNPPKNSRQIPIQKAMTKILISKTLQTITRTLEANFRLPHRVYLFQNPGLDFLFHLLEELVSPSRHHLHNKNLHQKSKYPIFKIPTIKETSLTKMVNLIVTTMIKAINIIPISKMLKESRMSFAMMPEMTKRVQSISKTFQKHTTPMIS